MVLVLAAAEKIKDSQLFDPHWPQSPGCTLTCTPTSVEFDKTFPLTAQVQLNHCRPTYKFIEHQHSVFSFGKKKYYEHGL